MATKTKTTQSNFDLTASRRSLLNAVNIIGKSVATRSSLPILTHFKVSVTDGRTTLMATDLESWVAHTLPETTMSDEGAITVPSRNFTELLNAMPDADIILRNDTENAQISIQCNKASYKLLGLMADEFPVLPELKDFTTFEIDRMDLRTAIKQTLFAVSHDETRAILTGALMTVSGETMKLVATDTHRLACRDCKVLRTSGSVQVIIPAKALSDIDRIMGTEAGTVSVGVSSNQAKFHVLHEGGNETTLITRLIDGQYPNYERVIPMAAEQTITLVRATFAEAVKRAEIVAAQSSHRVILRSSEDGEKLTLTAESGTVGKAYEEMDFIRAGVVGLIEIAFNGRYMLDVLGAIPSDGITLAFNGSLKPGVIRPVDDNAYLCVLMPMQIM
jgi:DNA polymerase-3 subunit beta